MPIGYIRFYHFTFFHSPFMSKHRQEKEKKRKSHSIRFNLMKKGDIMTIEKLQRENWPRRVHSETHSHFAKPITPSPYPKACIYTSARGGKAHSETTAGSITTAKSPESKHVFGYGRKSFYFFDY